MIFNCINKEDIENIVKHPEVFHWLVDDYSNSFEAIIHPNILYLMNKEKTGVVRVDPMSNIICSVHIATLPTLWGQGRDFIKEAFQWGFTHTRYQKVVGILPVFNKRAIKFVENFGFRKEGVLTKSFLKNWKLHDQIIYCINKGDSIWQQ